MVIGGGHCSVIGAAAFNGNNVGSVRSSAFGWSESLASADLQENDGQHRSIGSPRSARPRCIQDRLLGAVAIRLVHEQSAVSRKWTCAALASSKRALGWYRSPK